MRLPKWLGDKIIDYQGDLEYKYQWIARDDGYAYDGVPDGGHELYWWFRFSFNEEYVGNTVYVTPDFGEIWASIWLPTHRCLRLCKIGWHVLATHNGKPFCIRCKYGR